MNDPRLLITRKRAQPSSKDDKKLSQLRRMKKFVALIRKAAPDDENNSMTKSKCEKVKEAGL